MYHGNHSVLAQIAGFLALPLIGGFAIKHAAPALESAAPKVNPTFITAGTAAAIYGAAAFAAYKMSENDHASGTLQSAARGAMWSGGIAAAFCALAPLTVTTAPMVTSGALGSATDKTFNLLTAQAAGAVAQKRALRLRAARAALPVLAK